MDAKGAGVAIAPHTAPFRKHRTIKIAIIVVLSLSLLALALGLGLGLGLRHSNSSNGLVSTNPGVGTNPAVSWKRDPQEYLLSKTFDTSAGNATRFFTLNLTEIADGAPDGVARRLLLINGQFPGPVIEANEGDRLVVKVNNFLTIPSSIHWHGQYQNGIPIKIF